MKSFFLQIFSVVCEGPNVIEKENISIKLNRRVSHITNLKSSFAKNESKSMLVRSFTYDVLCSRDLV